MNKSSISRHGKETCGFHNIGVVVSRVRRPTSDREVTPPWLLLQPVQISRLCGYFTMFQKVRTRRRVKLGYGFGVCPIVCFSRLAQHADQTWCLVFCFKKVTAQRPSHCSTAIVHGAKRCRSCCSRLGAPVDGCRHRRF